MTRKKKEAMEQGPVQGKWDLPEGWTWKRLGEVCIYIQRGKSPRYTSEPGIPVINQKCIRWNELLQEHIKYTEFSGTLDLHRFVQQGDILWNSTGTGTIGRALCVQKEPDCKYVVDSHVTILRPSDDILSKYLHYYIMSNYVQHNIERMQSGSTNQVELTKESIFTLNLPLPPTIQDQQYIVAHIDSFFAKLDKVEETLRHTITLCEQYKQSMLKAAVIGELSKEWRKANQPTETGEQFLQRILKERRSVWEQAELAKMIAKDQKPANDNWKKKYKEPQAPDTSGLPELPEGWTWASMEQLTSVITSGSRGWADYYSEDGAVFIRAQDIKTDSLVFDSIAYVELPENSEGMRTRVATNDILVTITGANVTKTALVQSILKEAYVSQHVALCRPVLQCLANYLYLWIICPTHGRKQLESLAYGAGKPGLSLENIRNLNIALPPGEEQKIIYSEIQNNLKVNKIRFVCEQTLKQFTFFRQSILKQAFTGQLA